MPSGVHNANGLTPKQELFCQLLSRGQSLSAAYREAYASTGSAKTVNEQSSRIWAEPKICARVEGLLAEASQRMMRDSVAIRRHVFSRLLAESQNMENKGSERIAALALLGKIDVVSMFREIHSVERLQDRMPEEIEAELQAKLSAFLAGSSERNGATPRSGGVSTEIDADALLPPPLGGTEIELPTNGTSGTNGKGSKGH